MYARIADALMGKTLYHICVYKHTALKINGEEQPPGPISTMVIAYEVASPPALVGNVWKLALRCKDAIEPREPEVVTLAPREDGKLLNFFSTSESAEDHRLTYMFALKTLKDQL